MKHLQQVTEFFSDGIQSVSSVALMRLFHCIHHPGDQNLAVRESHLLFNIQDKNDNEFNLHTQKKDDSENEQFWNDQSQLIWASSSIYM